ncbi:MAG: G5 domain-containing protein [Candidatus Doudnabacteria bacterium]|nr:G5 domain-containing protein [bacterium]MDZ4243887.1 G5 domain-containing protein [Candidatus Doudnabacteria bacterium]
MRKLVSIILIFLIIPTFYFYLAPEKQTTAKFVVIANRNLVFEVATYAKTVGEILTEQNLNPSFALVSGDEAVNQGMRIVLKRPVTVKIIDGGEETFLATQSDSVGDVLYEQKIGLAPQDRVTPPLNAFLADNLEIVIDRIVDLEVDETAEIPYEILIEQDSAMYYGREEVIEPGKPGSVAKKFLITYKNGVETRRKLLTTNVLANPVKEIRKFGTRVEIERVEEGRASWYAYKVCMCAAHPSYDKGQYVRVTSLVSGKSIIVRINDRGPEQAIHPDRVIDLDSVAFKQFAPLGAGTIGVRVELLK